MTADCLKCGTKISIAIDRNSPRCKIGRNQYSKTNFGISKLQAQKLRTAAGCCAICGKDHDLVVDHCHTTGKLRGVICRQCNMGLGLLGDNIQALTKAVAYLVEVT